MKILNRWWVGIPVVCISAVANAQLIEDIELRREGANVIANVRFVTPIQYRRSVNSRAGDLGQAFYDVLPARDNPSLVAGQRKIVGGDGLPQIVIVDETVDSGSLSRKLVIRFNTPTRYSVRAGRGNRSIEIVLAGVAGALPVPTAPAKPTTASQPARPTATASVRRYFITIHSSVVPGQGPSASIPAALQDYETFTASRVIDGKTLHDTNVGYFATLQEAESARRLLLRRFPDAAIVAMAPVPGASAEPAQVAGEPGALSPAEVNDQAETLMAAAQAAYERGDAAAALEPLNQLLNLPPNASTRSAQELVGMARLKTGDIARARAEFELFLNLYPTGQASDRVREQLSGLPLVAAAPEPKPVTEVVSPWSGSLSAFYYGGKAKTRSQEFLESPVGGLPELLSSNTISDTVQSQVQTTVDLNWRRRDAESDTRFVLRDSYSADLKNSGRDRNRLSALYLDRRSLLNGTSFKVGRQSPSGGGVLYRFDGLQTGYVFAPKWKVNAMAGAPSDKLLDTRRRIYGAWVDAEALTNEISGSLYFNQQTIDGAVDRRALGTELRYFSGGVSSFAQFDYDTTLQKINISSVQATWQLPDTTVFNFNYDHRAQPILSLGNILFFPDSTLPTPARRLQDLLAINSLDALRDQVKGVTAYQKTALLGVTTPLSSNWQIGADVRLSNTGAVKPVPVILPNGLAATGNLWSVGGQLIGSNLYSARDTQLFNATLLRGPSYRGTLLSYNNLSSLGENWQVEPSLRYYRQTDTTGLTNVRWTPGLRVSYKVLQQLSLESELVYERSKSSSPLRSESSNLAFYYLGVRYDF